VLIHLELQGWVLYDGDVRDPDALDSWREEVTPEDSHVNDYIVSHICHNPSYLSILVDDYSPNAMKHDSLFLLCGGDELYNYEETPPDGGFMILGFLVGMVMVGMIFTELQKFDRLPRERRQRYEAAAGVELEMV